MRVFAGLLVFTVVIAAASSVHAQPYDGTYHIESVEQGGETIYLNAEAMQSPGFEPLWAQLRIAFADDTVTISSHTVLATDEATYSVCEAGALSAVSWAGNALTIPALLVGRARHVRVAVEDQPIGDLDSAVSVTENWRTSADSSNCSASLQPGTLLTSLNEDGTLALANPDEGYVMRLVRVEGEIDYEELVRTLRTQSR